MLEEGIVDPTKVTRSALQHAASVAAMFLTTEAVVATIPEKKITNNQVWYARNDVIKSLWLSLLLLLEIIFSERSFFLLFL